MVDIADISGRHKTNGRHLVHSGQFNMRKIYGLHVVHHLCIVDTHKIDTGHLLAYIVGMHKLDSGHSGPSLQQIYRCTILGTC